jgi:hypothetical protein
VLGVCGSRARQSRDRDGINACAACMRKEQIAQNDQVPSSKSTGTAKVRASLGNTIIKWFRLQVRIIHWPRGC